MLWVWNLNSKCLYTEKVLLNVILLPSYFLCLDFWAIKELVTHVTTQTKVKTLYSILKTSSWRTSKSAKQFHLIAVQTNLLSLWSWRQFKLSGAQCMHSKVVMIPTLLSSSWLWVLKITDNFYEANCTLNRLWIIHIVQSFTKTCTENHVLELILLFPPKPFQGLCWLL